MADRRLVLALLLTLVSFPASAAAAKAPASSSSSSQLRVSLDAAARSVGQALSALNAVPTVGPFPAGISSSRTLAAAAREDCAELLGESLHLLAGAGAQGAARDDAMAWLSAALTHHDTCADGLAEAGVVSVADAAFPGLAAARAAVRDSLAMYAASTALGANKDKDTGGGCGCGCRKNQTQQHDACGFPRWLPSTDRRLFLAPAAAFKAAAELVVAQDGTGTHATIGDAVRAAPECSARRTVIHVNAGRYDEIVRVGSKKTNLVFVGDGANRTVVTGRRSAADNFTTFQTPTFAASGSGFMMRDMAVENTADPVHRQAVALGMQVVHLREFLGRLTTHELENLHPYVALRVSGDRAVVHNCTVSGHQDTLYAHAGRHFYRDCDVYGTVDFVFGNAAAVLQRCTLWSRAPLPKQDNTVTAQGRCEPCQDTGLVLHHCRILPVAVDSSPAHRANTYLGRPWRPYSRVVVMLSYIGPHVPPQGWMQWNDSAYALDTLYFGEYRNGGPGAGVGGRVAWRGHRVIADDAEAERFTVASFIAGASWLPDTGVTFGAGLSL
ncbi:hypothetical protein EJB05_24211, partial [Eragrostis curvula]